MVSISGGCRGCDYRGQRLRLLSFAGRDRSLALGRSFLIDLTASLSTSIARLPIGDSPPSCWTAREATVRSMDVTRKQVRRR